MPQEKVNPGYSIGPSAAVRSADPDASSSLGFYFCFDGDDDVYATCVHHALGSSVPPVAVGSIPPIPIRHPSICDLDSVIMDNEADLQKWMSGQISEHALLMSIKSLKEYIAELKNQKTDFGLVVGSAFGVVDVDGQPVSEDWLVIKVNPDRVGENHICGAWFTLITNQSSETGCPPTSTTSGGEARAKRFAMDTAGFVWSLH
jgi:hypothetical protein